MVYIEIKKICLCIYYHLTNNYYIMKSNMPDNRIEIVHNYTLFFFHKNTVHESLLCTNSPSKWYQKLIMDTLIFGSMGIMPCMTNKLI
jgi:hypothetical protein